MKYYTTMDYFANLYDRVARQYPADVSGRDQYEAWKKDIRIRLAEAVGLNLCQQASAEPVLLDVMEAENYTREHWVIQTEPGVRMPFFLLKPLEGCNGGLVINPHGHGGGKEGNVGDPQNPAVKASNRDPAKKSFAEELVQAGYYVACPDARGSGERREIKQQGDLPENWRSSSHKEISQMAVGLGMSMIGMMTWDLMRLLDHLIHTLPDLDPEKVACAGMSGGGHQSIYFAALDERVKCVVTSGYMYGFKEALLKQPSNCSCNYAPNLWKLIDMGDIGAMIAPRPLFVESGRYDPLAGANGLENVYPQVQIAREAYELLGKGECLVHSVHEGGHQWNGTGVIDFINKCFKESR